MKNIISTVVGIAAFCGVFYLSNLLINFLVNTFPRDALTARATARIILWILAFTWTFVIALLVGKISSVIMTEFLIRKKRRKHNRLF